MEIEVDLNSDDFVDYINHWNAKHGSKKRKLFLLIISSLIFPYFLMGDTPFDIILYLILIALTALVFLVLYTVFEFIMIKFYKNLPSKNGVILGKKKFIIEADGLIEETEFNHTLVKWNGIKSIETSEKSIFIFVDKIAAYVIPKRFFIDNSEQELFVNTIKEKMKEAKS
jgi:hypothetical protein